MWTIRVGSLCDSNCYLFLIFQNSCKVKWFPPPSMHIYLKDYHPSPRCQTRLTPNAHQNHHLQTNKHFLLALQTVKSHNCQLKAWCQHILVIFVSLHWMDGMHTIFIFNQNATKVRLAKINWDSSKWTDKNRSEKRENERKKCLHISNKSPLNHYRSSTLVHQKSNQSRWKRRRLNTSVWLVFQVLLSIVCTTPSWCLSLFNK